MSLIGFPATAWTPLVWLIGIGLNGNERKHIGGTCYSNNYYFYSLLASLDYTVRLCGADMSTPETHMASIVNIEGREFLVDVGYAAPFLSPLPRDLITDYIIVVGQDRCVLKPQDAEGSSQLELCQDGILKHGYLAKPEPKKPEDFSLKDRDELGQAVEELFGIPQGIVNDAVGELRKFNDAWN